MGYHQPFQVECFYSCDKELGIEVLNGREYLKPSTNEWDWLGPGIYFWEHNPQRALEYALENSTGSQFNKIKIKTPFVLGAVIELGNCLNLVEPNSLSILSDAYIRLSMLVKESGAKMPLNNNKKRLLDCSVIDFIHNSRKESKATSFDTIRSPFIEGDAVYPGANFTMRNHLQICVCNPDMIKGFFLPRPLSKYNPNL